MSNSNTPKLKGRPACETRDCIPTKRCATTGRVLEVAWVPKGANVEPRKKKTEESI